MFLNPPRRAFVMPAQSLGAGLSTKGRPGMNRGSAQSFVINAERMKKVDRDHVLHHTDAPRRPPSVVRFQRILHVRARADWNPYGLRSKWNSDSARQANELLGRCGE